MTRGRTDMIRAGRKCFTRRFRKVHLLYMA